MSEKKPMQVEIWGDIVCPYCYIGKARFRRALESFPHADEVQVSYRAFELDPRFDRETVLTVHEAAKRKYGMSPADTDAAEHRLQVMANTSGLPYSVERPTANTFDVHRVLRYAEDFGLRGELTDAVFRVNFAGEGNVFDHDTLVGIAQRVGLDPDGVRKVFDSDAYADEVRAEARTVKRRGLTTVPYLLIDGEVVVSGAKSVEAFAEALETAWNARHG
ncbi:DsbA family oxidoreductase [Streptomyces sp. NPDC054919]